MNIGSGAMGYTETKESCAMDYTETKVSCAMGYTETKLKHQFLGFVV